MEHDQRYGDDNNAENFIAPSRGSMEAFGQMESRVSQWAFDDEKEADPNVSPTYMNLVTKNGPRCHQSPRGLTLAARDVEATDIVLGESVNRPFGHNPT